MTGGSHAQVDDGSTVWVADGQLNDGRLRVFTKEAAGEWGAREVEY